jgi:hypothetical protein
MVKPEQLEETNIKTPTTPSLELKTEKRKNGGTRNLPKKRTASGKKRELEKIFQFFLKTDFTFFLTFIDNFFRIFFVTVNEEK